MKARGEGAMLATALSALSYEHHGGIRPNFGPTSAQLRAAEATAQEARVAARTNFDGGN